MNTKMKDLSKINELIDIVEKSQKNKNDCGTVSIVVEGIYNPHETDLRNVLFCDNLVWEHTTSESGRVVSKFYRVINMK